MFIVEQVTGAYLHKFHKFCLLKGSIYVLKVCLKSIVKGKMGKEVLQTQSKSYLST